MASRKVKAVMDCYSSEFGQLEGNKIISVDASKADVCMRTAKNPGGLFIQANQKLETVDAEIAAWTVKAEKHNKKDTGTIDISDGVSDAEAALAGRALSARKNK